MNFTEQIQDLLTRRTYGKYDPSSGSDKERKEHNSRNSRHGADGGTSSYYGEKGDGPGRYEKTGYRYTTTQPPGWRPLGSNRKEIGVYTWMPDAPEQQAPPPAPPQVSGPEPEAEAYKPSGASDYLLEARRRWDSQDSANSPSLPGPGSGIKAPADYGNKATDGYSKRFLPQMKAQSDLEALEIGRSGSDAIRKFVGEPPKLGDPKDLFNFYSEKINSAVD